jgi:hypothetical protein
MDNGVLGEELAKLELGIVQGPVTRNVARNLALLTGIDPDLLPVDHELVIAYVAANNDVACVGEGVN